MLPEGVAAALDGARLVCWDFDGSLAHTEPRHERSFARLIRELGAEPEPGFFRSLVGFTEIQNAEAVIARYRLGVTREEFIARRTALYCEETADLTPHEFVGEVLAATPLATHVVTSSAHWENVGRLMDQFGLSSRFSAVWCHGAPGDLGGDKRGRLERAIAMWGRPAVLVEDTDHWLDVGRERGMVCLRVSHQYNGGGDVPALGLA